MERDYKKENQRQKEINKTYTVKIPIEKAKKLEEKLKKENKKYAQIARELLYKYIDK